MHYISHVVVLIHLLTKTKTTGSQSLSFSTVFLCLCRKIGHPTSAAFENFTSSNFSHSTWKSEGLSCCRPRKKGCAFVSCQWKQLPALPAWLMPHRLNRQTQRRDRQWYPLWLVHINRAWKAIIAVIFSMCTFYVFKCILQCSCESERMWLNETGIKHTFPFLLLGINQHNSNSENLGARSYLGEK